MSEKPTEYLVERIEPHSVYGFQVVQIEDLGVDFQSLSGKSWKKRTIIAHCTNQETADQIERHMSGYGKLHFVGSNLYHLPAREKTR